jgi:hypothetical protein
VGSGTSAMSSLATVVLSADPPEIAVRVSGIGVGIEVASLSESGLQIQVRQFRGFTAMSVVQ